MIFKNISIVLSSNFLINILSFLSLFFVAHYLGPNVMGEVAYAISFVGFFSIFTDMGFFMAHKKIITEGEDIGVCNGTFITIKSIITVFFVLLTVFFTYFGNHFGIQLTDNSKILILIMVVVFSLRSFQTIPKATLHGHNEFGKDSFSELSGKFIGTMSRILVSLMGLGAIYLAYTYLLGALVIIFLLLFYFRKYPINLPTKKYLKKYIIFALPLSILVVLEILVSHFDKLMIASYVSTEDLGIYVGVLRISIIFLLIPKVVGSVIFPTLSVKYKDKDTLYLNKIIPKVVRFLSFILTPLILSIILHSEDVIGIILGSEFKSGKEILILLLVSNFFIALSNPHRNLLIASGKTTIISKIGIIFLSTNLFLNIIMIPDEIRGVNLLGLGAQGAALATLSSSIISFLICLYISYSFFKIDTKLFFIFSNFFSSLLALSLVDYISLDLISIFYFELIFDFLLLSSIYFISMYLLRQVDKSDIDYLSSKIRIALGD